MSSKCCTTVRTTVSVPWYFTTVAATLREDLSREAKKWTRFAVDEADVALPEVLLGELAGQVPVPRTAS